MNAYACIDWSTKQYRSETEARRSRRAQRIPQAGNNKDEVNSPPHGSKSRRNKRFGRFPSRRWVSDQTEIDRSCLHASFRRALVHKADGFLFANLHLAQRGPFPCTYNTCSARRYYPNRPSNSGNSDPHEHRFDVGNHVTPG